MSSADRSTSPSTQRVREPTQATSEPEEQPPLNTSKSGFIPTIEACGRFLLRCIHPFVAADTLMVVAREQVSPGSSSKYQFQTKQIKETYGAYSVAALSFSEDFRTCLEQNNLSNVERSLARGISQGRSGDLSRLKTITANLASKTNIPLPLVSQSKSDRGFNNNETGRMLIPIRDLKAYNEDPVSVRAKVNAGSEEFQVTGTNPPAFLYEDPDNYDPKNALSGFLRGYFLTRCLRAIFSGPRTGMQLPTNGDRPTRRSVSQRSSLKKITPPTIVYVAVLARHLLSTQNTWSGKDGTFDYQDFANLLFRIFEVDEEWTTQTIRHWNLELFGNEDGAEPDKQTVSSSDPDDFLGMVKDQLDDRQAQKTAAEQAPGEETVAQEAPDGETMDEQAQGEHADPWGDGASSSLSDPPGDDLNLALPPVTPRTPPTLRTGDSRGTTPAFEPNMSSPIRPATKKRYGKQRDNGTGDQVEDREVGDETQQRASKRSKPANPAPQAKPKSKSKSKPRRH